MIAAKWRARLAYRLPDRARHLAVRRLHTHVSSVGDLLHHYPRRYIDRSRVETIGHLKIGAYVTVIARVVPRNASSNDSVTS